MALPKDPRAFQELSTLSVRIRRAARARHLANLGEGKIFNPESSIAVEPVHLASSHSIHDCTTKYIEVLICYI